MGSRTLEGYIDSVSTTDDDGNVLVVLDGVARRRNTSEFGGGGGGGDVPNASTTVPGKVELETPEETAAGEYTGRASTAAGVAAAIAAAITDVPTMVDQEYPPSSPAAGTTWLVPSLGHVAVWSGTAWVAVTPTDPELNICCILGTDCPLLLDRELAPTGTNLGSGGSALNGTLNGAATTTDGDGRPVWDFDGVDDSLTVPDHSLLNFSSGQSLTIVAVASPPTVTGRAIFGKRAAGGGGTVAGYQLAAGGTPGVVRMSIGDGAVRISPEIAAEATGTSLRLFAGVRDTAADAATAYDNGQGGTPVADTTTGSLSNTQVLGLGFSPSATYTELTAAMAAVFRRALTQPELTALGDWMEARWS